MSNTMTNEEAIRILDPDCKEVWKAYDGKDLERYNEACRLAVKALELQIPKRPIFKRKAYFNFDGYFCPNCNIYIKSMNDPISPDYCRDCGQALDWSDEK